MKVDLCVLTIKPEKKKMKDKEVDKLLTMGYISEVNYLNLLAHVVLVKKYSDKRRMCINYIVLNKACLENYFPLP